MNTYESYTKEEISKIWSDSKGSKAQFAKALGEGYDKAMRILYYFDFVPNKILDAKTPEEIKFIYDSTGSIQRAAKQLGIRTYWLCAYVHKHGWDLKLNKPIRALTKNFISSSSQNSGISREEEIKEAFNSSSSQKEFADKLGVSIASAVRYQRTFNLSFRNQVSAEKLKEDALRVYNEHGALTQKIYAEFGQYSNNTLRNAFGSLDNLRDLLEIPNYYNEEDLFFDWLLSQLTLKFDRNTRCFDWLLSPKGYLMHLDGYNKNLSLAIEYDDASHYRVISHMGGEDGLKNRQERDHRKDELCAIHGIKLIRFLHTNKWSLETLQRLSDEKGFEIKFNDYRKL